MFDSAEWHIGFCEESCELGLLDVRLSLRVNAQAEEPGIRNSNRVSSPKLGNPLTCLFMKLMTEQFSNLVLLESKLELWDLKPDYLV